MSDTDPIPMGDKPKDLFRDPRDAINTLLGRILERIPEAEKSQLPTETSAYVNALVQRGLERVQGEEVTRSESGMEVPGSLRGTFRDVIGYLYHSSPTGERFLQNPKDGGCLFVDGDGELVSLQGVEIGTIAGGLEGAGTKYIKQYTASETLTGPNKGYSFTPQEKGIAAPPEPVAPPMG